MEKALHPHSTERLTAVQFWREFGANSTLRARCPACKQPMSIRGGDRGRHAGGVFAHLPMRNGEAPAPCPLRNAADHRYAFLSEPPSNPEQAKRIRDTFLLNWEKHYSLIRENLRYLDVADFVDAIRDADRTQVWHRSQLAEWEVAYLMLVTHDWPPVTGKDGKLLRSEWVRFWFEARVRTLDDLWIRRDGAVEIIKATYKPPARGIPGARHLIDAEPFAVDSEFLAKPHRAAHDFVVRRMRREFPDETGSRPP